MAETHAEDRNRRTEAPHDVGRDAGFHRRTGTGRKDDVARRERGNIIERERVVPAYDGLFAELAHVAGQVINEGIMVIDEQNHARTARASIMPRALSSVSRYSCSGSESATMPPPALKYIRPANATAVRMAMLLSTDPLRLQ